MENQNVIVYLNTPLIKLESKMAMPDNAYRIKGKVISKDADGLSLQVKAIGDEKRWNDSPPLKKIYLPIHKVDFISLE